VEAEVAKEADAEEEEEESGNCKSA